MRQMESSAPLQPFNLETMAGVFPGVRTQRYQRVRLLPMRGPQVGPVWAQILWYEQPAGCILFRQGEDGAWDTDPLLQLSEPGDDLLARLIGGLREAGWQLQSCGSCHFWSPSISTTIDRLPAGQCGVAPDVGQPAALITQSALALDCPHWLPTAATTRRAEGFDSDGPIRPLQKIAEISESKLKFWPRLWRKIKRAVQPVSTKVSWEATLVERSGVGAGTEPCFGCQGRIANLGALAVETLDGDTQTFSVWRCRACYTTYLNDWIDRWVRLDSLETEESYFRIAPAEARDLLDLIDSVRGGEHPGRRRERGDERAQILRFLDGRTPLSHQIRQGR